MCSPNRGHFRRIPPEGDDLPVASNLTRDEAAARSALITVSSYQVDLDLTTRGGDETTFRSVTVIRFGCHEPGAASFVDLTAPGVREITLNGAPVGLDAFDGDRSEEHTSELQSQSNLVCRLLLEKKKKK